MRRIEASGERADMVRMKQFDVQKLEGRTVSVGLADGSVLDRVPLILARRNTLWVISDGEDAFIPLDRVVDIRPAPPFRVLAA